MRKKKEREKERKRIYLIVCNSKSYAVVPLRSLSSIKSQLIKYENYSSLSRARTCVKRIARRYICKHIYTLPFTWQRTRERRCRWLIPGATFSRTSCNSNTATEIEFLPNLVKRRLTRRYTYRRRCRRRTATPTQRAVKLDRLDRYIRSLAS